MQRHHPTKSNPNSFLFKRRDPRSHSNTPIKSSTLSVRYWLLKNKSFPKVLENAELSSEDKEKVRRLLQKPCNPYVRRHTALSEKVRSSKINEYNLRKHAGWSKNSKMLDVYTHDLGDSSSDAVLESWGIVTKDNNFQGIYHDSNICQLISLRNYYVNKHAVEARYCQFISSCRQATVHCMGYIIQALILYQETTTVPLYHFILDKKFSRRAIWWTKETSKQVSFHG